MINTKEIHVLFVMDMKNQILIRIYTLIWTTKLIETVDQPCIFLPIYKPYYLISKSMLIHPFLHLILLTLPFKSDGT
jgi:hypothetical protein